MKQLKWFILGSFVLLAACRSSYITSSWKSKNAISKKYNEVLVLSLIRDDDRRLQEKMEKHMGKRCPKMAGIRNSLKGFRKTTRVLQ